MNALELAMYDAVQDGMKLNTKHLIKLFKVTSEKVGGDAPLSINMIIELLDEHLKQLEGDK